MKNLSVPTTIIGNSVFVGFTESSAARIEDAIRAGMEREAAPRPENEGTPRSRPSPPSTSPPGETDISRFSLTLLTLVIAGLDSFNPCALFVLMFLLSLLVHARSRARMFIVGGTFVVISGFVYFLFMAAWLNFFFLVGNIALITTAAGAVALVVGP